MMNPAIGQPILLPSATTASQHTMTWRADRRLLVMLALSALVHLAVFGSSAWSPGTGRAATFPERPISIHLTSSQEQIAARPSIPAAAEPPVETTTTLPVQELATTDPAAVSEAPAAPPAPVVNHAQDSIADPQPDSPRAEQPQSITVNAAQAADATALPVATVDLSPLRDELHKRISENKHYPVRARRFAMEGTAMLAFTLTPIGDIEAPRVARSSGHDILDEEALAAVKSLGAVVSAQHYLKAEQRFHVNVVFALNER